MRTGSPPLSFFAYSLCAGLCLMCFALLLHPASPEDFLALCFTDPLAILQNAYGIQASVLFLASLMPAALGAAGMLHRTVQSVYRASGAGAHLLSSTIHVGS